MVVRPAPGSTAWPLGFASSGEVSVGPGRVLFGAMAVVLSDASARTKKELTVVPGGIVRSTICEADLSP